MFRKRHDSDALTGAADVVQAYASVKKAKLRRASATMSQHEGYGEFATGLYRVDVMVEPAEGPPFEASFSFKADMMQLIPHVGGKVPVRYRAADLGSVEWDEQTARDDELRQATTDRERRTRMAVERAATGQPPLGLDGPDPELIAELATLEARRTSGELNDWQFRQARAEIMKSRGF